MKKNFFDPEVEVVELNVKPMKRLSSGSGDVSATLGVEDGRDD